MRLCCCSPGQRGVGTRGSYDGGAGRTGQAATLRTAGKSDWRRTGWRRTKWPREQPWRRAAGGATGLGCSRLTQSRIVVACYSQAVSSSRNAPSAAVHLSVPPAHRRTHQSFYTHPPNDSTRMTPNAPASQAPPPSPSPWSRLCRRSARSLPQAPPPVISSTPSSPVCAKESASR